MVVCGLLNVSLSSTAALTRRHMGILLFAQGSRCIVFQVPFSTYAALTGVAALFTRRFCVSQAGTFFLAAYFKGMLLILFLSPLSFKTSLDPDFP